MKRQGKLEESQSHRVVCAEAQVRTWHMQELELTLTQLNIECEEAGGERCRWRALFDMLRSLVADWKAVGSNWKTSRSVIRWGKAHQSHPDSATGHGSEGSETRAKSGCGPRPPGRADAVGRDAGAGRGKLRGGGCGGRGEDEHHL